MQIHLNDCLLQIDAPMTLLQLLEHQNEPYEQAIVEHNGRFVWKSEWASLKLKEGDRIEVILPAFGG